MTNENTEKAVPKNLGDTVAKEHLGKCVKVCLMISGKLKVKA